jgi:TonB-dependent starch-binding outer membrane protein SusC
MKNRQFLCYLGCIVLYLNICSNNLHAQNSVEIKGKLIDELNKEGIANANIIVKGKNQIAKGDEAGNFSMVLTAEDFRSGTLEISAENFETRSIKVNSRRSFNITLKPIINNGELVVTSSYKKTRKEEVVGSVTTITSKQLQIDRPIESLDKMLEGQVAGLQVEGNTQLGTPVKINIRGPNALNSTRGSNSAGTTTSAQPLFFVDGIPILEQRKGDEPIAFISSEELLNPLANINPDDIETITILKDAAAVSIYGANGSNGVILITTKSGKAGKTRVNVSYSSGLSSPINRIKFLSGPEYYTLTKELFLNEGRDAATAEILAGSRTIDTDWFGLLNRRGSFNNLDINMGGGSSTTRFNLTSSYFKRESIQKGNDYEKIYFSLRLDQKLSRNSNLSVSVSPTYTKKNALNIYGIVPLIPNLPVYEADGKFYEPSSLLVPNPLAVLEQNVNRHTGGGGDVKINFDVLIYKNIKFSSNSGLNVLLNKLNLFESPKNATGRTKNGFAEIYDRNSLQWVHRDQLDWNTKFSNNQTLSVLAGFELNGSTINLLRGGGRGFSYYRLNELSNAAFQFASSSKQKSSGVSAYTQIDYNFNDKYFAIGSARRDAASIFGTDVNAAYNGALGLGWAIHKESFFKNYRWLSNFKLRSSFGTSGNSRIGGYASKGIYSFTGNGYADLTSAVPQSYPNPDLSWERSVKSNIGVDIGIYKSLNVTVEVYQDVKKNNISPILIPIAYGFSSIQANVSDMKNTGIDLTINYNKTFGQVNWTSTLTLGRNKNKIIRVINNSAINSTSETATSVREGYSTSTIWGYTYAGVDPSNGAELFYDSKGAIVPINNLDYQNLASAYPIGDRLPKAFGGFINSVNYKNFTLTINMLYNIGGNVFINYRNELNGRNLDNRNMSINLLDRWTKPGDISSIPKLSRLSGQVVNSSRYVYDDTYFKISNVSLSYRVPKAWSDKLRLGNISAFGNITNLVYWYKDKRNSNVNGVQEYKYDFPEARSFTWGIKMGI